MQSARGFSHLRQVSVLCQNQERRKRSVLQQYNRLNIARLKDIIAYDTNEISKTVIVYFFLTPSSHFGFPLCESFLRGEVENLICSLQMSAFSSSCSLVDLLSQLSSWSIGVLDHRSIPSTSTAELSFSSRPAMQQHPIFVVQPLQSTHQYHQDSHHHVSKYQHPNAAGLSSARSCNSGSLSLLAKSSGFPSRLSKQGPAANGEVWLWTGCIWCDQIAVQVACWFGLLYAKREGVERKALWNCVEGKWSRKAVWRDHSAYGSSKSIYHIQRMLVALSY